MSENCDKIYYCRYCKNVSHFESVMLNHSKVAHKEEYDNAVANLWNILG